MIKQKRSRRGKQEGEWEKIADMWTHCLKQWAEAVLAVRLITDHDCLAMHLAQLRSTAFRSAPSAVNWMQSADLLLTKDNLATLYWYPRNK